MVIIGSIQNDSYTNRDGQKVTTTQIIVDEMEFAESKTSNEPAQNKANDMGSGFMALDDLDDSDLPFN